MAQYSQDGYLISNAALSAQLSGLGIGSGSKFTPTASSGSGTVSGANTDKTALSPKADRVFLLIQNTSQSAWLTINYGAPAYTGGALVGFSVGPGDSLFFDSSVPVSDVHIASASSNATYYILEG